MFQGTTDIYLSKKSKTILFTSHLTHPGSEAQHVTLAETEETGATVSGSEQRLSTDETAQPEVVTLAGAEAAENESDEVDLI